ncbi:3-oxoacyl-[acyl-carrier protein] reductase [Amycolatopsis arida]|uniref:3-oxoacyl-[acyl-carrier protein] reductase n=1 Tax=Amycolatopsis arida TaxID=587909 RepID=A0A1I6A8X1_9PSEU|nr:SDR family NAD(P)-dependent oxidoreductase [Amycolatopsis arida]TDX88510.1 3-oxoacyl-[acyl-carrier protein] reductase [Amycolatopsis arida]SFQ65129.1 3-oxoacyl-[acyl-carrier protein] reductase [Amycolatopsis arida]
MSDVRQPVLEPGLAGARVLVTGGSRGIGRAICRRFAAAGATVVTTYRVDDDAARRLRGELGESCHVLRADVTRRADLDALMERVGDLLGGLDVLVNNVGVDGHAPLAALDTDEWDRVLDTNLTGAFDVTRAAAPLLVDGASVVNIGASVVIRGLPGKAHYCASKAGLTGMGRSLAKELGGRAIRVNTVAPGVVETEPGAGLPPVLYERLTASTALGRLADPDDVACVVTYLAGPAASYVTGATVRVDGGI